MNMTRRGLLAGLLAGVAAPAWADAPAVSPRPVLRDRAKADAPKAAVPDAGKLVAAAKLGGVVGYVVADLASGQVLEASGEAVPMPPASVCKAVTALYALEKLGVQHRFTTRVMRVGEITNGRLEGDLILAGGGDPTFDTDKMGDLVAALAASGLREVTGRLIAYTGALPTKDMISADQPDQVGYNPAISGLMLNYNRVNFVWKKANKSWQVQMNAEGERFVPPVQMATMKVVSREAPLFTYQRGEAQDNWTVAAAALGKNGSRWLPVRHAAVYVADVFRTMCAAQGIKLPVAQVVYTLPEGAAPIVAHDSDALPDLLRKMLKYSTNLPAEAVGLAASGAVTLEASGAAMTEWARARFGITATLGDHSGLGPVSRVTPADMARLMIAARASQTGVLLQGLMKEAGVADAKGKPQAKSAVRVHVKSGTMNFVSNLAGYITAPDGRALAFAVFTADLPRRNAVPVDQREQPEGDAAWVKRAHRLQQQLISRWAAAYL